MGLSNHFCFPIMQTTAANYRNIMIRPEQFQEILLDKVSIEYFFWNTTFPFQSLYIYYDFI